MLAFMFPGQGSQHLGMGAELFDAVSEFRDHEQQIDQLLGYSLRHLCCADPHGQLRITRYTQPALFVVNALHCFRALAQGDAPSFLAGHSLGEYNALLAAGAFDFMTGLTLVQKRGELMSRASGGAMAAVVGLQAAQIERVLGEHRLTQVDIANYNSARQTVISGAAEQIARAGTLLEQAGASMYVHLPVSAAFHSRFMAEAATEYAEFLQQFTFRVPRLPVIANVTGRPYPQGQPSATVRYLLIRQFTGSVQWQQTVTYLYENGVSQFKEVGPGKVLTRLLSPAPRVSTASARVG